MSRLDTLTDHDVAAAALELDDAAAGLERLAQLWTADPDGRREDIADATSSAARKRAAASRLRGEGSSLPGNRPQIHSPGVSEAPGTFGPLRRQTQQNGSSGGAA